MQIVEEEKKKQAKCWTEEDMGLTPVGAGATALKSHSTLSAGGEKFWVLGALIPSIC